MANGSSIRWRFVRHADNGTTAWTWQRFGPDGWVERTSEPYATYGKALMAALQTGFRPDQDDYSMDLPYGRLHFPPGGPPEICNGSLPLEERASRTIGEQPYAKGLSPKAWALLEVLHRAAHGGPPPPPALKGLQKSYEELLALGLVMRSAERMKITDKGEAALRDRYLVHGNNQLTPPGGGPGPPPQQPGPLSSERSRS
jgi:hypothetical protein